jgi:hypothetical protein
VAVAVVKLQLQLHKVELLQHRLQHHLQHHLLPQRFRDWQYQKRWMW